MAIYIFCVVFSEEFLYTFIYYQVFLFNNINYIVSSNRFYLLTDISLHTYTVSIY